MTTALAVIGGLTVLQWVWVLGRAFIEGYQTTALQRSKHMDDVHYVRFVSDATDDVIEGLS
jgi:hypothetical protein